MIFSLFGGKDKADNLPKERGPLGIALGGAIEIDTLALEADAAGTNPGMALPAGGNFIVVAYGEARLDGETILSRYYDEDDRLLQALSSTGKPGDAIKDISLYSAWDSVVPADRSEWNRWAGPAGLIGQPSYDADGIVFQRYWGEGAGRAELVEFVEEIDDGERLRSIHQTCMLYARPLGRTQEMLLINIERDIAERASREGGSVAFLLGYGLSPGDVRRV
ncbi:DUF2491 family protein [Aurantimonas sp. 22II-16-19i]|uniref:DUF2491 family protein n=1 Tax=Aurantimonas sp. 22II-16-19i TaxID=1317114 RepID=UPI0009F7FB80|nr:DUF2491 family protein [Aurantimonas sp. 22II-16-19i]ORE97855.1 hypothetical protein ATO4_06406 [Aurantimonas sp. 22II-16-19i]